MKRLVLILLVLAPTLTACPPPDATPPRAPVAAP